MGQAMNSTATSKEVHLVLGAGGAKCISYAGALSVLEERGIRFKTVSSCSAGTLIGALLCAGKSAEEILRAVRQDLGISWSMRFLSPMHRCGFPSVMQTICRLS
jgi:predicted acylesterase/phospholipase RssA